ncbi:MAG: tetratricopeptide repeat protein [Bacteroidales bacterium]|nr:tetratricopeptide repeat protein [Bacteroidales bacterium]
MKKISVSSSGRKPPKGKPVSKGKPALTPKKISPLKTDTPVKKSSSRKANWFFVSFFFVFALILYGNTIFNKYAVDDIYVTNNPVVKLGIKAIPKIFNSYYVNQQGNLGSSSSDYRPIVRSTFALEYQLWGEKPGRSHSVNILIYFLLSTLLFFILRRLLKNYNILFPFLITVIFMAHPVHTEVVASLKNRDEMLAFLCGLGSLSLLLDYAEKRKLRYVFFALLVFFIGYLCKSSIVPFLLLIPLTLYFFTDLPVKKYVPIVLGILFVGLFAFILPRMLLPHVHRIKGFVENPLFFESNFWIHLGTGLVSLLFYLKILVYPHPLLHYYGYDMIPVTNLANIWVWVSIILYAGMLIYAILKFREKHFLSYAIFWFLIAIAMYSNILVPVMGIVGERFVFNASLGFSMALVYIIFLIFKTQPKSLTIEMDSRLKILAVVILLLIPCTAMTVSRNRDWRNLFDLYRSDIKFLDKSAKGNLEWAGFLMGTVYNDPNFLRSGGVNELKLDYIITHFKRSLQIYPRNYKTLNDLGTVYLFMAKNSDSAILYLNKAIELDPSSQPAYVNLGMAYRQLGKYPQAIECFEHILKINPTQVKAIFALADVYNDMGDFNRAVKMNEDVMKAYPKLEMPYINIGNYYMLKTDTVTAVSYWEKAAAIHPSYELCVQLNSLYVLRGDREKADYYYNLGMQVAKQNQ